MDVDRMAWRFAIFVLNDRMDKALSRKEYGDRAGVSPATVARVENCRGLPSTYTTALLCQELGKSPNEVLGWDEKKRTFEPGKLF